MQLNEKDIRILLQNAAEPSLELDTAIALAINSPPSYAPHFTTDYNFSIYFGCTEDKTSFSSTPLLSLWLAVLRLELGDERKT